MVGRGEMIFGELILAIGTIFYLLEKFWNICGWVVFLTHFGQGSTWLQGPTCEALSEDSTLSSS